MNRRAIIFMLISLMLILTSCFPTTTIPIGITSFKQSEEANRKTLLVFLPGRGDNAVSYLREGFIEALRQHGISADSLGVEAHLGYYRNRTLLQRLKEDVILPAKMEGYRKIWLVGISMGGLGALLYDIAYPGDVDGVILLAPYLGEGTLLEEITRSGGIASWQPKPDADGDLDLEIWSKLKEYSGDTKKITGRVFLGFGESDRFVATNRFFAASFPSSQVITLPGEHDWASWKALWPKLLAVSPLTGEIGVKY